MISDNERILRYLRGERDSLNESIQIKTDDITRLNAKLTDVERVLTKIENEGTDVY